MTRTPDRAPRASASAAWPLLLLSLLAGSPRAQEVPQDEASRPAVDASADDLTEEAERVLHLEGGQVLRTRARLVDGAWEVQLGRGTASLPGAMVLEQHRVAHLLRDARARERRLDLSQADHRADQALWLAERGLCQEALEHMEVALRKDPDHGPTLTLVERGVVPLNLPALADPDQAERKASIQAYLGATATMRRASREIALRHLAAEVSPEELVPSLLALLEDRDARRRELGAQALHRLEVPRIARLGQQMATDALPTGSDVVRGLTVRAILDGSDDVRGESARALRDLGQEAVILPFVKALGSASASVRTNSAEALEAIAVPAAAPALVSALAATASGGVYTPPASHIFVGRQFAYVQDFDVEAFSGVVAADPQINVLTEGAVLDVRILSARTQQVRVQERSALRGALKHLTGQDFRYDAEKWAAWLDAQDGPTTD